MPGTLDPDGLRGLIDVLRRHTGTRGRCWFGIWEGLGWIEEAGAISTLGRDDRPSEDRRPSWAVDPEKLPPERLQLPGRSLVVDTGPIEAATAFCDGPPWQSPDLWWPADRAWCVGTDIDACSTSVAGSPELVDELLADDRIEAVRVEGTDPVR